MATIRTKICGITRIGDAELACEAGADAIGLNFYPKSKRFIDGETAAAIAGVARERVAVFGVFVNATVSEVLNTCEQAKLSHVQFHGDEAASIVAETRAMIPHAKIVRAIRVSGDDFESAQKEIEDWQNAGADMLLLDAASLGAFGGTGKQLDWNRLHQLSIEIPWLLAGGLDAANVATAIANGQPDGVDVASGVESEPGIKAPELVRTFVENSRSEFSNLSK